MDSGAAPCKINSTDIADVHPMIRYPYSAAPRLARTSARSLPGSPLWPFTHRHLMRCLRAASSSARHGSLFLTGFLSAVVQPRFFQLWIHSGDAFADVLAVGEQLDVARPVQGGESLDHGGQFHPVVRGAGRTPSATVCGAVRWTGSRPSRRAVRVPLACPVGVDHDARQRPGRRLVGFRFSEPVCHRVDDSSAHNGCRPPACATALVVSDARW